MDAEKSIMWRVAPEVVALVDALTADIAAIPALRAEVGVRRGKPTRAGVLRLLVTRGATSVQGTIREWKKAEQARAEAALAEVEPQNQAQKGPPAKATKGKGGKR
jgi:hypothetical protein